MTRTTFFPPLYGAPAADITIVGLGPGDLGDLTLAAWQSLCRAPKILLRTERHPLIPLLKQYLHSQEFGQTPRLESCDDLYELHDKFDEVYQAITERVLTQAQTQGPLVYAVPGSPNVGEATTNRIMAAAQRANLRTEIIGALSFIEPSWAAVGVDAMNGSQVVDAMLLAQQHHPQLELGLPVLVGQLYAPWLASDVKLTLLNGYPATHEVTLIQSAGTAAQRTRTLPLHTLDQHDDFDHLTSLYVPPLTGGRSVTDLLEIVAHLRAPEGCPWDQEQTLESLRQDLLGECVEVLEAVDLEAHSNGAIDNSVHIAEELGDLLLLIAMMTQIAVEEGRFQMADVTHGIVTKLIRRHPHVFGDTVAENVGKIIATWDEIKAQERAAKGMPSPGPLDGIPTALPALEKARQTQSKAAKTGQLDRSALAQRVPQSLHDFQQRPDGTRLGNLLWAIVALAKEHDLNAEDALRTQIIGFRHAQQS